MKSIRNMVAIAATALTLILASCAKDGVQGPAGTNGNANVKVYYFGSDSMSTSHNFTRYLHIKQTTIDSSMVLSYFVDHDYPTAWYMSPGLGYYGSYMSRFATDDLVDSMEFDIKVLNPDGTAYPSVVHLDKVKIIIVPGSSFGKKDPVDYSDYKATMKYYHLPE